VTATTFTGNKLLDLLLRGVAWTPPSRVWVSLHTADPGRTGANEVSTVAWPAYARQDPAAGAAIGTGFAGAANRETSNAKQILFPRHDGTNPITIGWITVWDAATGGNALLSGHFVDPDDVDKTPITKTFHRNDEAVIYPGELSVEVL